MWTCLSPWSEFTIWKMSPHVVLYKIIWNLEVLVSDKWPLLVMKHRKVETLWWNKFGAAILWQTIADTQSERGPPLSRGSASPSFSALLLNPGEKCFRGAGSLVFMLHSRKQGTPNKLVAHSSWRDKHVRQSKLKRLTLAWRKQRQS